MTFYVQGLSGHEVMPLLRLFDTHTVEKAHGVAAENRIDPTKYHYGDSLHDRQSGGALQSYQDIDRLQKNDPVLVAEQIMTTPVVSFNSNDLITDAMKMFHVHPLRHIPVVTDKGIVEGIVSDRDILHYLSGVSDDYKQHVTNAKANDPISKLMKTQVLTASIDTDVRYIARLFVEKRVGAMPIVVDGSLMGIITRSDILSAVMRHFVLELWV